jgi:ribosomal-protein-alanine N-acetyltransferase
MPAAFPTLYTERLKLIEINDLHLADIFKLFGDDRVTKYYNVATLQEEASAQKFIDHFSNRFAEGAGIRWGIASKAVDDRIIGTIGFNNFEANHRATIGYDLQAVHWGNRYAVEAINAVAEYGFTHLNINRIEAEVMQGNHASEKVLAAAGFKNEGILRQWMYWNGQHYDMTMFSLLSGDRSANLAP